MKHQTIYSKKCNKCNDWFRDMLSHYQVKHPTKEMVKIKKIRKEYTKKLRQLYERELKIMERNESKNGV